MKILIVEDEKPIADLIDMSLTARGYQCTCVYDGAAAADLLVEKRFRGELNKYQGCAICNG